MQRRDLLKTLVATTLTAAVPGAVLVSSTSAKASVTQAKPYPWKNWSGNQSCYPNKKYAPSSVEALKEVIHASEGNIRMVGSGHSFSELVPTDQTLVSIRRLNGLLKVDPIKKTASFYGGTTLGETGPVLADHGQGLFNMPDVDHQTLAGAISTATHGTGRSLGSLSSYVESLTLITATGEELRCSANENPDLFSAAQVGLGAMGVISGITLKNMDAYKLKRDAFWLPIDEVMAASDSLSKDNRHFEFFYFPFTGMTLVDTLNVTTEPVGSTEEIDGNSGIMDLKAARDYLSWSPKLRELIVGGYLKTQASVTRVDHSYAIYANDRNVRFNEMEYHLPLDNGMKALGEVIQIIERDFPEVFFPIECRYIKSESAWLSPFYERDAISIAVHRYFEEDFKALFKAIEVILQKHGGRPHWGKVNTFTAAQCRQAYPKWQEFLDVRQQYDPTGKFLNVYLERLFSAKEA
jgi:FAD-linked oxidoreductase